MDAISKWLSENKEWVFSGAGFALFTILDIVISLLLLKATIPMLYNKILRIVFFITVGIVIILFYIALYPQGYVEWRVLGIVIITIACLALYKSMKKSHTILPHQDALLQENTAKVAAESVDNPITETITTKITPKSSSITNPASDIAALADLQKPSTKVESRINTTFAKNDIPSINSAMPKKNDTSLVDELTTTKLDEFLHEIDNLGKEIEEWQSEQEQQRKEQTRQTSQHEALYRLLREAQATKEMEKKATMPVQTNEITAQMALAKNDINMAKHTKNNFADTTTHSSKKANISPIIVNTLKPQKLKIGLIDILRLKHAETMAHIAFDVDTAREIRRAEIGIIGGRSRVWHPPWGIA